MPMLIIAAAALAASPPPSRPVSAVAQATATIRILTAVEVKFDGSSNNGAPTVRVTRLQAADGTTQSEKLVEFQ